jgi:gamma-glutamylcyclotransferase (GGCT)/AIG2-like uncharacterized protein YtfP
MRGNELNRINVFIYGTIITKELFRKAGATEIEVAFLLKYRRLFNPAVASFPFAISDPTNSGFFGLKIAVETGKKMQGLDYLDHYEGAGKYGDLYVHQPVTVRLRGNRSCEAIVYVPTEKTVKDYELSPAIDLTDAWRDKFNQYPWLQARYPELLWTGQDLMNFK